MTSRLAALLCVVACMGACGEASPQGARPLDYDYLYDDIATPDLQQPVPQFPVVAAAPPRPRARQPPVQQVQVQQQQQRVRSDSQAGGGKTTSTTPIPILKDRRTTDPKTGIYTYEYMGADGSGKYEVRYPNGTVIGNFTYINDAGEQETRWYSAGTRGTEIAGDSVISPAPPTLVDETTGPNYIDLSNYELYRHLEVPYVHIEGPSDPDERGQLSNPERQRSGAQPPLDFGDDTRFVAQQRVAPQRQQQVRAQESQPPQQQRQEAVAPPVAAQQAPSRVARKRVRVVNPAAAAAQPTNQRALPNPFDPRALDVSSPDAVLDSLINQFQ